MIGWQWVHSAQVRCLARICSREGTATLDDSPKIRYHVQFIPSAMTMVPNDVDGLPLSFQLCAHWLHQHQLWCFGCHRLCARDPPAVHSVMPRFLPSYQCRCILLSSLSMAAANNALSTFASCCLCTTISLSRVIARNDWSPCVLGHGARLGMVRCCTSAVALSLLLLVVVVFAIAIAMEADSCVILYV